MPLADVEVGDELDELGEEPTPPFLHVVAPWAGELPTIPPLAEHIMMAADRVRTTWPVPRSQPAIAAQRRREGR
jgi:hypothetical protein